MADPVPGTTVRWEYTMVPMTHHSGENISALNAKGADGWELCHVGLQYYLLKRRVQ